MKSGGFFKIYIPFFPPLLPNSELHLFHVEKARKGRGMFIVLPPLSEFYERLISILATVYKVTEPRTLEALI